MKTTTCRDCGGLVSKRAKKCPHCGGPQKRKTSVGAGCLAIVLGTMLGLCVVSSVINPAARNSSNPTPIHLAATPPASRPSDPPLAKAPEKRSDAIPGIMPVDVYLNMEKRGYTTEKELESGRCVWMCAKRINLTAYGVECYGSNPSSVRRVNASLGTTIDKNADAIALSDFMYVASLPYDGADPARAQRWVQENMGKNAKTKIGPVTFELQAPSDTGRWLSMYIAE